MARLILIGTLFVGALIFASQYIPVLKLANRPEPIPVEDRFFLPANQDSVQTLHFSFATLGIGPRNELRWCAYPVFGMPVGETIPERDSVAFLDPYDFWYLSKEERQELQRPEVAVELGAGRISWKTLQDRARSVASFAHPVYITDIQDWDRRSGFGDNPTEVSGIFKVLLDLERLSGIGYRVSRNGGLATAHPIDSIEAWTGLDLYHELMVDSLESIVEGRCAPGEWEAHTEQSKN